MSESNTASPDWSLSTDSPTWRTVVTFAVLPAAAGAALSITRKRAFQADDVESTHRAFHPS